MTNSDYGSVRNQVNLFKEKINEVVNQQDEIDEKHPENVLRVEVPWGEEKFNLEKFKIYSIPLSLLTYNKYNGRILSRTKTFERNHQKIDVYSNKGKEMVADLLFYSKKDANKTTLESLNNYGQQQFGIITMDGVIIDGNRRAMLLNRIPGRDSFKTIILPINSLDNRIEIEKFETIYQLGEDKKLDYNNIEIYLKIKNLYNQLNSNKDKLSKMQEDIFGDLGDFDSEINEKNNRFDPDNIDDKAIETIYKWIGNYKNIKSKKDIIFTLNVMNTMDDYLEYLNRTSAFMALDDREEQFRGLTRWLDNYYGNNASKKVFSGYKPSDIDTLRDLCFGYIRIKTKNDRFRWIGGAKEAENHIIGREDIWKAFAKKWKDVSSSANDSPSDVDASNPREMEKILHQEDNKYASDYGGNLENNLDEANSKLKDAKAADEPEKLVKESIQKFEAININNDNFKSQKVQKMIGKLLEKIEGSVEKKSPLNTLGHINHLLGGLISNHKGVIVFDTISESDLRKVKEIAKEISSKCYKIQNIR